jgi:hypothetical protein
MSSSPTIPCPREYTPRMRKILSHFLIGISSGWLLAAVVDRDFTSPVASIGAALGGTVGIFIGSVHASIAASCRADLQEPSTNTESDRLLLRAMVILALAASPILIYWVITSLSDSEAHRQLASIVAHPVRGFGCVVGALSIWLVVRSFNKRQDRRHAKRPLDTL